MASDTDLIEQIRSAPDLGALDQLRVSALGKSGSITAMLKSLGAMDPETRTAEAPKVHALREEITSAIAVRKAVLEAVELDRKLATETIDLSLPSREQPSGTVHPVSQVMDELAEIFADLGFAVAEGPEIEDQWHNFTALNMPEFHPARAMQDTFYLERREGEDEKRGARAARRRARERIGHRIGQDQSEPGGEGAQDHGVPHRVHVLARQHGAEVGQGEPAGLERAGHELEQAPPEQGGEGRPELVVGFHIVLNAGDVLVNQLRRRGGRRGR